jgi:hypothetical protein
MQLSHNTEAVEQLDESELRITRFGKFIAFPPQPDYPKRSTHQKPPLAAAVGADDRPLLKSNCNVIRVNVVSAAFVTLTRPEMLLVHFVNVVDDVVYVAFMRYRRIDRNDEMMRPSDDRPDRHYPLAIAPHKRK